MAHVASMENSDKVLVDADGDVVIRGGRRPLQSALLVRCFFVWMGDVCVQGQEERTMKV